MWAHRWAMNVYVYFSITGKNGYAWTWLCCILNINAPWSYLCWCVSRMKTKEQIQITDHSLILSLVPHVQITRQIWGIWKLRPAYSPETPNLGQNRWCFVPCDLEFWWMTLENDRASLLCCFKLCATFHSHRWIQTGVTVRKRPIWVKFDDFLAVWPRNLIYDLEKQ